MMTKNKPHIILIFMVLFIGACGARPEPTPTIDPEELMTQIAATIEAEITQNAMLTPSPTATLPPTETPPPLIPTPQPASLPTTPVVAPQAPGLAPDNARYVKDVTFPDDKEIPRFNRSQSFVKTWRIENNGTTTWDNTYYLVYVGSDDNTILVDTTKLADPTIYRVMVQKVVKPEEQLDISMPLKAPDRPGTYKNYFSMMNDRGQFFGEYLSVEIIVGSESVRPTPMPG